MQKITIWEYILSEEGRADIHNYWNCFIPKYFTKGEVLSVSKVK